ncbi:glycosyltransferase family 4 protein [Desulfonatronum sp. SC1]|uniref:glycosyltransferase family 4 protein n=1 Tax=Desulfonatronum sp. SC1 TaxID=2109626 RepID=UPI000D31323B|nr:glycosyltransferase family 4 protein [Desulfonatronum sp. SC1]PTN32869.1 group 1 glycosyl transferase [Desulfonatronum sp. SC1]
MPVPPSMPSPTSPRVSRISRTPRFWATLDPFLEPGAVWGRKVANEQFLAALLRRDPFDEYHFFLPTPKEIQAVQQLFQVRFPRLAADRRLRFFLRQDLPSALRSTDYHCFHLSDCINHPPALARLRNAHAPRPFPITSVTHSLSYPGYPARFLDHLHQGCTPRDCIVATSTAGQNAVLAYFDHLRASYNLDQERFPQPETAVIPLGMDEPWNPDPAALRKQGRAELEVGPETRLLLVLGRITPHSKMDILPLLRAWQRISGSGRSDTQRDVVLVVAGWVEPKDDFPGAFTVLARNVGLPCRLVPSPDEARKQRLYAAADIFLSLADNPQETFGLTLLEAGLAGLPTIAADYSGYRDIIQHDQTGLLVPTWGPPDSSHIDMLSGLIPDYEVQFLLAQQTAVHVPDLAAALRRLLDDPLLCATLGTQAREHVRTTFSWSRVIGQYLTLWQNLWERTSPHSFRDSHPSHDTPRPLELPFSKIFGCYPSAGVPPQTLLVRTRTGDRIAAGQDFPVIYAGLEHLISPNLLKPLLILARNPIPLDRLIHKMTLLSSDCTSPSPEQIRFIVHWAVKHDLLEIVESPA